MALLSVRFVLLFLLVAGLPGQQVSSPGTPHHGWYGVGQDTEEVVVGPGEDIFVGAFVDAFI